MQCSDVCPSISCRDINPNIANLAVEPCSVDVPLQSVSVRALPATIDIDICRQDSKADETRRCHDCGPVVGVTDDLSAEVNGDRAGNKVASWWEVHDGVFGG